MTRIRRQHERAVTNLHVVLRRIVGHPAHEPFQFTSVSLNRLCQVSVVVRYHIGIREPHHRGPDCLSKRTSVHEARIGEMRVPVEIVVRRVIGAATTFAMKAEVHRRNPEVLQECGVVRSRAQRANLNIAALASGVAPRGWSAQLSRRSHSSLQRRSGFRIGYIARHTVDELLKYVRSAHTQISSASVVGVQICHRMLRKIFRMRLGPLCRAKHRGFLAVPRCVNDCTLRTPPLLLERTECPHLLELRDQARYGIICAVYPRVMMIRTNDELIRLSTSGQSPNYVIYGLDVPV